ncbi:RND multidrug efflux transporter [Labilithrix luteola]|uniref:RND multidrug efflux transporter n=1 Tax=Labilithrix luteola TaxID=1391654 RepID=A0A0K1PXD7_9BACT|nr:efflux RND transporter permease subunit [Labilithrix luteola]AKU98051.1 RND multidrug efflux transporter [Labilithrix luteola]
MQWLARVCIQRPVFATVLMLLLVVLGGVAYGKLGLDQFPNVDLPIVVVTTTLPGSSAQEIESDVTDKIEGAVNTISGIDELRSTSSEGVSIVVITFAIEKPVDVAAQDVRDKVNQVMPDLPKGIDQPVISKVDPGASPILFAALRSKQPIRETTELADKVVRRQIESIDGVGEVKIVGGRKRQINVLLDPIALRSQDITALDVQRALATQNLNVPGGSVETGPKDITLRVAGRVGSVDEVGRIVVKQKDGRPVRVADLGRVEDGSEKQESAAQYDDEPTVVLQIKKQSGKNTVEVVDTVLARLDEVRKTLPPGVSLDIVYDNSGVIRTSTHAVLEHLVLGAALAAVIVLVFLGSGRSTLIAAMAIPISIIGTFAVMYAFGFTLNFLTLLALALAVGLVIDDAIVVIENIMSFIERRGYKPFPAAVLATKEIGLAVLSTTLALIAVFVPIAFMGGIIGKFLKSFGLTMASAIGVSLLVSFSITPMLGARWLKGHEHGAKPNIIQRLGDGLYGPIERVYMTALRFSMKHRWVVVIACFAALFSMGPVAKRLGGGFLPANDKAQYQMSLRAPEGTSVAETQLIAERVAQDIKRYPGVTHTLITIGDDEQKTQNLATIRVLLTDPHEREVTQEQLMNRTRTEIVGKLPKELRVTVAEVPDFSAGGGVQANVMYAVTGPNLDELSRIATTITDELRNTKGAVDVDNTLIVGKPEIRVSIDRDRASDLGVEVADVASALQLFVGGLKVSTYSEDGQQYDIRARADENFRTDPDTLQLLSVPSSKVGSVPLSAVVKLSNATGPSKIERLARGRQITISANSTPDVGDNAVGQSLVAIADKTNMPAGYRLLPLGISKESGKMAAAFGLAFGMSFVFMYLILAAQFESWLNPFIILLALPLTVPFGFISLLIFGQSINMFSMLGLLVLFGVVQKNAVLQIDHTMQLLREGKPRLEAILEANKDRLRPILMTSLAFVAGMVPLVVSKGIGAGFNQAMSGIVVGGQALSLVLTLLATPVMFSLFTDAAMWVQSKMPKGRSREETGEAELSNLDNLEERGHAAAAE